MSYFSEIGDYLALDLGGTNFRVLLITLNGTDVSMKNKIFPISEQLMLGHGDKVGHTCSHLLIPAHNCSHLLIPTQGRALD